MFLLWVSDSFGWTWLFTAWTNYINNTEKCIQGLKNTAEQGPKQRRWCPSNRLHPPAASGPARDWEPLSSSLLCKQLGTEKSQLEMGFTARGTIYKSQSSPPPAIPSQIIRARCSPQLLQCGYTVVQLDHAPTLRTSRGSSPRILPSQRGLLLPGAGPTVWEVGLCGNC